MAAHPCRGCHYAKKFSTAGKSEMYYYCDYLCMEGHRRPCDPGKGCKVKRKAEEGERRSNFNVWEATTRRKDGDE